MTIATRDQLIAALGNNSSRFILDKASLSSQVAGTYVSLWRATGVPGQGVIPSAAASCNNTLLGGMAFAQQTLPATSYLGQMDVVNSNNAMTTEIHDRIAHMGGLNGTLTTAQTVGLDLATFLASNNTAARIGPADYSNVSWWLEWYTATGSTAATVTVNVTYNDSTTGNLTGQSLAATRPVGFMTSLNLLVPASSPAKFIRAVNTVTLSASTGATGNFGVTATRTRAVVGSPLANFKTTADWATLGLPEIHNSSCLVPIVLTSTSSSGTVRGGGVIAHG